MTGASPAEIQALIAAEFDQRRWEYTPDVGHALSAEIRGSGVVDPEALAQRVPADFLYRNATDRAAVVDAITRAVGGRTPVPEDRTAVLNVDNRRFELKIGRGASIVNSNLNVGEGAQINLSAAAPREDLLAAAEAIVRAGLAGDWSPEAAQALATSIGTRDDVSFDDVREMTVRVVESANPSRGRIKDLLDQLAVTSIGGALATGMASGLGQVLPHIHF